MVSLAGKKYFKIAPKALRMLLKIVLDPAITSERGTLRF